MIKLLIDDAFVARNLWILNEVSLAILAVLGFKCLFSYVQSYLITFVGQKIM